MANFQSAPTFVGLSLFGFVIEAVGTTPGGQLSGLELTR